MGTMAIKFLRMEFRGYEILLPFHNIRGFGNLKPLVKNILYYEIEEVAFTSKKKQCIHTVLLPICLVVGTSLATLKEQSILRLSDAPYSLIRSGR
jgi:hypothetical protein